MARRKNCVILLLLTTVCAAAIYDRPHIIFILADDLVSIVAFPQVTVLKWADY
jgi:hypothetical protein